MAETTGENASVAEQPAVSEEQPRRRGYLEWEDYFMAVAGLAEQRSKDPRTQVGACIVNRKRQIVGIGYNGMPKAAADKDNDDVNWSEGGDRLYNKHGSVVHAEANAVLHKMGDVEGGTMYVTLFPCNECAKIIIQSGIKMVWYLSDRKSEKVDTIHSKELLDDFNVDFCKFEPDEGMEPIEIDLNVTRKESEEQETKKREKEKKAKENWRMSDEKREERRKRSLQNMTQEKEQRMEARKAKK